MPQKKPLPKYYPRFDTNVLTVPSLSPSSGLLNAIMSSLGWLWPTESERITQNYSDSHHGIDIGIPEGTPIYAPADGSILKAGWSSSGYGNLIKIGTDDGYTIFLGHLSGFEVSAYEKVGRGDLVGYSGDTGNSTGPHLHFEVRQGSTYINPFSLYEDIELPPGGDPPKPPKPGKDRTPGGDKGDLDEDDFWIVDTPVGEIGIPKFNVVNIIAALVGIGLVLIGAFGFASKGTQTVLESDLAQSAIKSVGTAVKGGL